MATSKEYYEKHKKEIREYQRKYRANSKNWQESNERWKQAHPEEMILYRKRYNHSTKGRFKKLQLRAKRAGIAIELSMDEFVQWYEAQELKCYYCKREIVSNSGVQKLNSPCIDRKNNILGYLLDNIALSCNRCNLVKGSWFTEQEMMEIASKYLSMR